VTGVALEFSVEAGRLDGVFYDGARPEPDPELDEKIKQLRPPDDSQRRPPSKVKRAQKWRHV
jgi:hypothetical protein